MTELRDAAGRECTTVSWRGSEFLISIRKLSKVASWAFHDRDTLAQVTFETVRWLRRGSATKVSRKQRDMKVCQFKTRLQSQKPKHIRLNP